MKLKENYLLGIDLGTTNIKGNIMDDEGNLISTASRPNGKLLPGPHMVEQDPNEWWDNCCSILKEMTDEAGDEIVNRIKGVCISSQCVTMLPVDKDGNALYNAVIYQDSRSLAELNEIVEKVGSENFVNIVGGLPATAFLPGKLLWFKRHEPALFEKTYSIMQANSFLNLKLTGKFTIDLDTASRTQCMNLTTLQWAPEIGEAMGIDLEQILPKAYPSTEIIGKVTAEAASITGLKEGTPVLAGASDAMASVYASGMCRIGDAGESSGTSSLVFASAKEASAPNVPVVTRPSGLPKMPFVYDGPIGATGASVKWYIDTFGEADKAAAESLGMNMYDFMNTEASKVKAGSDGLLYFPYLIDGERAPLWNPHARGMFIGLNMATDRAHIARAVFEGTAFALRHVLETVKESGGHANGLRVTGGGAKSRTWNMIKASMLGMPVYVLDEKAGDVPFGDVLIAGVATGVFPDLSLAIDNLVKIKEIVNPIPEWKEAYDKLYPYYIEMYQHLDKDLASFKNTVDNL